jgi:hypothetical protein
VTVSGGMKWKSPIGRQVFPCRIFQFNQKNLLLAAPTLQWLFSGNGLQRFAISLLPDKTIAMVSTRKTFEVAMTVLNDTLVKIACNADV